LCLRARMKSVARAGDGVVGNQRFRGELDTDAVCGEILDVNALDARAVKAAERNRAGIEAAACLTGIGAAQGQILHLDEFSNDAEDKGEETLERLCILRSNPPDGKDAALDGRNVMVPSRLVFVGASHVAPTAPERDSIASQKPGCILYSNAAVTHALIQFHDLCFVDVCVLEKGLIAALPAQRDAAAQGEMPPHDKFASRQDHCPASGRQGIDRCLHTRRGIAGIDEVSCIDGRLLVFLARISRQWQSEDRAAPAVKLNRVHPTVGHAVHIELAVDLASFDRQRTIFDDRFAVDRDRSFVVQDGHLHGVSLFESNVDHTVLFQREWLLVGAHMQTSLKKVGVTSTAPSLLADPQPDPNARVIHIVEPQNDHCAHVPTGHGACAENVVVTGPDPRHAQFPVLDSPVPAQHVPARPDHFAIEGVFENGMPFSGAEKSDLAGERGHQNEQK